MGNVPISCCRSKSPRLEDESTSRGNFRNGSQSQYSSNNKHDSSQGRDYSNKVRQDQTGQPSHILQHISEREPDDSETDPSSNPLNRPIFASRSRSNTKTKISDSYSSTYSNSRRQNNTPLTISQDHGYNSTTSTNLTHPDGLLSNDSLDSSININRQQQSVRDPNELLSNDNHHHQRNLNDYNRLLLSNSPTSSGEFEKFVPELFKIDNRLDVVPIDQCPPKFCYNGLKKSSSCSTIFIDDSTISQPDLKQTMKCVSLAIYYHIKNRTSDNCAEIFDESIHPLKMPTSINNEPNPTNQNELIILDTEDSLYNRLQEPDQFTIYKFVKTLFRAAQLTSEYAITTLVYLERLMTYAEMDLTPKTWRRMFLGAILLSSKVWEDQAVWNVDYAQILEEISVEDINELERQFLELIQFNMNVPSSVYAKYYFHLRTLASKNGLTQDSSLLTVGQAKILEAMSRSHTTDWQSSPIHRKASPVKKRHQSLEKLRTYGQATAVLM